MKIEHIVIFGAIILIAIVTAISAHITSMSALEAKYEQELRIRDAEKIALQRAVSGLQQALRPKPYVNPLDNMVVSSGVGYRQDVMGGTDERLHEGLDLVADIGTPVKAYRGGIVMEHWPPPGGIWGGHPLFGGYIVIDHGDCYTKYGHLSATFVHQGDVVAMGQVIGLVGNTGVSTGSHLHFEQVVEPDFWMEE